MDETRIQAIKQEFKIEVCDNDEQIDPQDEHDWYCLSIGYFLAKSLSSDEAVSLACDVRYNEHYWQKSLKSGTAPKHRLKDDQL